MQAECENFVGGCGPSNLLNLTCASGVITKIEFASTVLNLSVPVNSRARVWLPAARPADVFEGGSNPATQVAQYIGQDGDDTVWNVGSGSYTFCTSCGAA